MNQEETSPKVLKLQWRREYYKKNKQRLMGNQKKYKEKNKERIREYQTNYHRGYRKKLARRALAEKYKKELANIKWLN